MNQVNPPPVSESEDTLLMKFCRDEGLSVTEIGQYGTWPFTNQAVIQFEDGKVAYVSSWADRTILDEHGNETRGELFGQPVAWASYKVGDEGIVHPKAAENRTYVALKHETTFTVAHKLRHYGFTEAEFAEHNGITPGSLVEGKTYHLPWTVEKAVELTPIYEVFETPKLFHISREGGAMKWAFANARTLKDIISGSGMYPENKEVEIAALAYVPLEGETFLYAMDELALGDYRTSGKVKYAIGFAHGDLSAGEAPEPVLPDPGPEITRQIEETLASIEPEPKVEPVAVPPARQTDDVLSNPDGWRATMIWYEEPVTYILDLPEDQDEILIHDLLQKGPSKRVADGGHYIFAGEFWKDGVPYALPKQCVRFEEDGTRRIKNYYGVPMEVLINAEALYTEDIELNDRLALHSSQLTVTERWIIPTFAMTRLSYDRLKLYGQKLKNKITKE